MSPHPLRVAWEARDADAVAACFTADGVFHSPVVGDVIGFRGRHAIAVLMRVVLDSTTDTEFADELSGHQRLVLGYRTKFNGKPVRGVVWLDLEPDGAVRELWTFVRPLTGVVAVGAAVAPALASRESAALGKLARAGFVPLTWLAWVADRIGSWLIGRLNRERR